MERIVGCVMRRKCLYNHLVDIQCLLFLDERIEMKHGASFGIWSPKELVRTALSCSDGRDVGGGRGGGIFLSRYETHC